MASTLLQLRSRVLIYLNDFVNEAAATGDRYPTSHLNRALNDCIHHYERLLNIHYQGYLSNTLSVNLVANTRSYDLAAINANFRTPIYQVRRTINDIDYFLNPIETYNATLQTVSIANAQWLPSWRLEGNNIVFSDAPDAAETAGVTVRHQAVVAELAADGTALNQQMVDAEDCIVLKAGIRLLKAKDVSGALKNIGGWESELRDAERAFFMQVGNRYVKPDKPAPVQVDESLSLSINNLI